MAGSKSNYAENKTLDHLMNDGTYSPVSLFLALVTVAVTESDTGATITEANYTGYARKSMPPADWDAAASGSKTTNAAETFAGCSGGTSTVIGWALVDNSSTGAGNILYYGTLTSTTISTTQTPATVAAGGIVCTED